jgi:hypothetical protein
MPAKVTKKHYENNPFFIASNGLTLLFSLAQGVGVLFVILSILGLFARLFSPTGSSDNSSADITSLFDGWDVGTWLLFCGAVAIIGLAIVMILSLFNAVGAYTSARIAQKEEVSIREAFREAFDKLWSFIWLQIIIVVKIILWALLFIIPGIIMAVRYSLANVAFFDDTKNLRGNAAIKESLQLTKGAWITTYAATALFNFLTLGTIGNVISIGTNAVLYRQFEESGAKKPAAHWLSWLTLVLPFIILLILLFFVVVIGVVVGLLGINTTS